jgi:hypothetical protein
MSDGVTDFWNAMHIVNQSGANIALSIKAVGYKQLFSPSGPMRNVPNNHTQDDYNIQIPANGTAVIGAGIYRNGSFDQQTSVALGDLGTVNFSGTTEVHGSDISQVVFWSGASNVTVPTGTIWNFNNSTNPVLTVTIN